jgi:hypothetical protein
VGIPSNTMMKVDCFLLKKHIELDELHVLLLAPKSPTPMERIEFGSTNDLQYFDSCSGSEVTIV